jgi:hypothetical protein
MAESMAVQHEWILFSRVQGYLDDGHHTPVEVEARWCGLCGTLDLGDADEPTKVRFLTTKGARQAEPQCLAAK